MLGSIQDIFKILDQYRIMEKDSLGRLHLNPINIDDNNVRSYLYDDIIYNNDNGQEHVKLFKCSGYKCYKTSEFIWEGHIIQHVISKKRFIVVRKSDICENEVIEDELVLKDEKSGELLDLLNLNIIGYFIVGITDQYNR